MQWLDWAIVCALLTFIVSCAFYTKRYTQSVADFLAANRCAGRYLLSISEGIAGLGAISVVAWFEMYYEAGFTATWWELMMAPIGLIMALSGWVIYRFRQTRALTLAQFFEVRYSRNFRIFAGLCLWVSGIVNFGIFPAVGARFFIHFCGLPNTDLMFALIMFFLLTVSLLFVFLGGQIAVMITDFFQGMFTNVVFLIILAAIFWMFDWSTIIETLKGAPEEASRIHPFHTGKVEGFNIWYFVIQVVTLVYGYRAWQGSQAYNCSAKSAHEAKMAGIIGAWRGLIMMLVVMLLPVGAYVIMHNADYVHVQDAVNAQLGGIDSETIQKQMTVPLALAHALPAGIVGLFCAVMLAAFVSTHDTYLHSWGSIFVQDVVLPIWGKPLKPKTHLWLLRGSILFVAIFIFCWSYLFSQTEYIRMFFAITGAIWLGGAGSVIVGGLYWKRGSTGGAFATLGVGAGVALTGIFLQQTWADYVYPWMASGAPGLLKGMTYVIEGISARVWGINWEVTPDKFPLDGQWVNLIAIVCAIVAYLAGSLFSWLVLKRPEFEMDRLLHRGKYTLKTEHTVDGSPPVTGLRAILPSKEFTRGDKVIYFANLTWTVGWFSVFIFATVYNLTHDVSDDSWAAFWWFKVILTVVLGVGTTIWFLFGGVRDIRALFHTLATMKRDHRDDGRVVDHHNVADEPLEETAE
jgi:SSS family solute:Na+ symporter